MLEKIAVEREPENYVVIFDRTTANNTWVYLMKKEPVEKFKPCDLETIAKYLEHNTKKSYHPFYNLTRIKEVGKNTKIYADGFDWTTKDNSTDGQETIKEIYMRIPGGTKLNGQRYEKTGIYEIQFEVSDSTPTIFALVLWLYGYTSDHITQIRRHFIETELQYLTKKERRSKISNSYNLFKKGFMVHEV